MGSYTSGKMKFTCEVEVEDSVSHLGSLMLGTLGMILDLADLRSSGQRHTPPPASLASVGIYRSSLMSFHPISASSLTPSRPAPPAPNRRPTDPLIGSYSGIGATPGGDTFATGVIRSGFLTIKEEGGFSSWIWKTKWVVLKEQAITIHKSEVRIFRFSSLVLHVLASSLHLS